MIIKVMLVIFIYFIMGFVTLEILLYQDRKETDSTLKWIKDDTDQTTAFILWPFIIPFLGLYVLFIGLKSLIKRIRILYTTIIFLIFTIIDKPSKKLSVPKGWIRCKDKLPEESNYYLVYEKIEDGSNIICVEEYRDGEWIHLDPGQEVIAWMPSPEGYKTESEKV